MSSPYAETDYSRYGLRRNGSLWVADDRPQTHNEVEPYRAEFGERSPSKSPLSWMDAFQVAGTSGQARIQADRQRPSLPVAGDDPNTAGAHILAWLRRQSAPASRSDLIARHFLFGCEKSTVSGAIRALVASHKVQSRTVKLPGARRSTTFYQPVGRKWPRFPEGTEVVKPSKKKA